MHAQRAMTDGAVDNDAMSDTPMLYDTLDDMEPHLQALCHSVTGAVDDRDDADRRDGGVDGDGGHALDAWLDRDLENIPASSTTADVVGFVKRATLQFGEAARLALLSQRLMQQEEDGDLGGQGAHEARETERMRRASEAVKLRCAYDEMVRLNPGHSTLGGTAVTARASVVNNKLTRHKLRAAIEELLRLRISYDQFDRMFRHINAGRDADLHFAEFHKAFASDRARDEAVMRQMQHVVSVLGGLWRALRRRGTTLQDEFDRLDSNQSGDASLAEFCSFMRDLAADGALSANAALTKQDLYLMATTIDKDGDGTIEIDEIRRFFYQLWRRRLSEMDEAIASVDLER